METLNWFIVPIAAIIPLLVGMIWYNPKVFGTAWMKGTGLTEEQLRSGANMGKIFGLTYLFSLMVAMGLVAIVIHQMHIFSVLNNEPGLREKGTEINTYVTEFMSKYGHNFRTFKHGALHGTIAGILLALPIIGVPALFERKTGKYIFINAGFWIVSMALMGGVICQFL
ncbi:DUF1761 domain-containing protein [Polluticoccus soli]|uniref:DUF1761 domain-containing protein n=1 Tax=Polluticoccus soli TaxID=3034150 RepID=UPI0023E0EAB0|nr:DUF1761 domain-containing protein [Flavipsychrobacter sp. JY13-12]